VAEQLKTFFSPALVKRLGSTLAGAAPSFRERAFVRTASDGLEELELLGRARHIAGAMAKHLPAPYPSALEALLQSLGPEYERDELLGVGMGPFFYMPHTIFVAEQGLAHFDLSLRALYELTKRFTAEFSIRAFLASDPERTMRTLSRWAKDKNAHVRRLVSEGTRLRLPWGTRVAWLDQHPERVIELLELLKDDPSPMVRRSVANNLNDIGRVHSSLAFRVCGDWLEGASAERKALVSHALRTAIKRAEPKALALLGYGKKPRVRVKDVRIEPPRVAIGEKVQIEFVIESTSAFSQDLLVDLTVEFVKATGRVAPKVFKLGRVVLPKGGSAKFARKVSLAVHTTRKPNPGSHGVGILLNGARLSLGQFEVVSAAPSPRIRRRKLP
jgi:3-methyladenine DNA glycosylase AlkC